jgi:hypothetical protein
MFQKLADGVGRTEVSAHGYGENFNAEMRREEVRNQLVDVGVTVSKP